MCLACETDVILPEPEIASHDLPLPLTDRRVFAILRTHEQSAVEFLAESPDLTPCGLLDARALYAYLGY